MKLTRKRPDPKRESWDIYAGDIRIGGIGERAGVPKDVEQWGWHVGFYPGMDLRQHRRGVAETFEQARTDLKAVWDQIGPTISPEQYEEHRRYRSFHAWRQRMKDAALALPTMTTTGEARCFCGAPITLLTTDRHIDEAHSQK